jgi:hypothetical protein
VLWGGGLQVFWGDNKHFGEILFVMGKSENRVNFEDTRNWPGRIAWGIHELHKVSLGPAMPYLSFPVGDHP